VQSAIIGLEWEEARIEEYDPSTDENGDIA